MHWSADYVGLPFLATGRDRAGVDCYGLVALCYREVRGIVLPSYTGHYTSIDERAEIAAALNAGKAAWTRVDAAREWDVVLFSGAVGACHVGLVVAPGRMLHTSSGHDSRIERYEAPQWRRRLMGVYRRS
ncbi:NlpC/P60 family protein [Xanthobacter sp. V4C-4]|uniref:NlpC/P60 family protein n=1 Tax=Xanthobacter cornucopiae TaxID=3119924 RepID=UPI00372CB649